MSVLHLLLLLNFLLHEKKMKLYLQYFLFFFLYSCFQMNVLNQLKPIFFQVFLDKFPF